jgi:DNA uptake protein ComE-like DNA-binding protein
MWHRSFKSAALWLCIACGAAASTPAAQAPEQSKIPESQRLDINHSSITDLEKLPGITQIWAERIVRFRPYHAKSDLRNAGIIPPRVYHRIESLIIAHRN